MRRISVILAVAALLLVGFIGLTYKIRRGRENAHKADPTPQIEPTLEAIAKSGWKYGKDDPVTNKPIVRISAQSFSAAHEPSAVGLIGVALRIYKKTGDKYTYVYSEAASFSEGDGLMRSQGPVTIVMDVPADKDGANPKDIERLVQVRTSGILYETKSGKADTKEAAAFHFPQGDGTAVGANYDPATGELHLLSNVSLNWVGHSAAENTMHIETADLVYKERERKIYLSPWSKLRRRGTSVDGASSVVSLDEDGNLQQVDSEHAVGSDVRPDKHTDYRADHLVALFNDGGVMTELQATGNAHVVSSEASGTTSLTGDKATLRFAVAAAVGKSGEDSTLHEVLADGHAVADSEPIAKPGVDLADSRFLRSEHIELEMRPDGKNVQEIRTPGKAQLEFKPNAASAPHRFVDASRLRVLYGDDSYIDSFEAWDAATRTDKPAPAARQDTRQDKGEKPSKPAASPPPALTWSDDLTAHFDAGSNQVSTLEQKGHFRYEEGKRKASAEQAFLNQKENRINLVGKARVSDDTGFALADTILMDQTSGDMDAKGHVVSTHAPDKNQKAGTSMLDSTQSMQARADSMTTRESNTKVIYTGHAVVWQAGNRITANRIDIDRDAQTLVASGDVVSELADTSKTGSGPLSAPIFTVVRAPDLQYRDDTRIADYTGGVALTRGSMTVDSKQLRAFLTPKTGQSNDGSSLDHAVADGNVTVLDKTVHGGTRKGTAEHCDYNTKLNKVVLTGGHPEFDDSHKGSTRGRQLTYFSDEDRLIVEGLKSQMAYTQMKKR